MAYMLHLRGMFVVGTYMEITCEIDIAVGFVLAYVCRNVESVCPFSMVLFVSHLQCERHICLVIYVNYAYSDTGVET